MSTIDFSRWAVYAPKNPTGLGRMREDIKKVLGVGFHFVAASERPLPLREGSWANRSEPVQEGD
jgi:hypothetical protein